MSVERDKRRGTWTARFSYRERGKRHQSIKRGFTTEAEALLWEAQQRVARGADATSEAGDMLLRDFAALWLRQRRLQPQKGPRTLQGYEALLGRYILPGLGDLKMSSIRARHIEALYAQLRQYPIERRGVLLRTGLSETTISHVHDVLRQLLRKAGYGSVIDQVDAPSVNHLERDPLTPDQIVAVLVAVSDSPLEPFVWLAMHGLGRSELLGLEWPDLRLDAGWLKVRQTRQWIAHKGDYIGTGKTVARRKPVFLAPAACVVLAEAPHYGSYVFADQDGTPWNYYYPDKLWRKLRPMQIRLYDLRHNYASWLMRLVGPATAAAQLRHASSQTTETWYTHTPDDAGHPIFEGQREAANAFGNVITSAILRNEDEAGDHVAITETKSR